MINNKTRHSNKLKIISINYENSIVIDIATLTGNVTSITNDISSICTSNNKGFTYIRELFNIGNEIGEYVDYIKIRNEYKDLLSSTVADIKNTSNLHRADCIIAASFLNYFINKKIPWVHIDLGGSIFKNEKVLSYGIYLMYKFINNIYSKKL